MPSVLIGEDLDLHDVFESEIQLAGVPQNGQLGFRLERPDGTLALDINWPSVSYTDLGGNKIHVEFRVDMPGIWYWDWKPDGALAALVKGWFRVEDTYIGYRDVAP